MTRVLIATAWWPTKTRWFGRWSQGIASQLGPDTELFVTTRFAESKFGSIVEAMVQAQEWALAHGFTHVFNVEADKEISPGALQALLRHNKPVVLMGRGSGAGLTPYTLRELDLGYGWGAMLVQTAVLKAAPFNIAMFGEYISPDRVWFKRLLQLGITIWMDHDTPVVTMEEAARGVFGSFTPTEVSDGKSPQ